MEIDMRRKWLYRGVTFDNLTDVVNSRNTNIRGAKLSFCGARSRVKRQGKDNDVADILDAPVKKNRSVTYTHDGITLNAKGWSEKIGSSHTWFNTMIKKYGFAEAIHMRPRQLNSPQRYVRCPVEIPKHDQDQEAKNLINSLLESGLNEQQVRIEIEKRARF